MPLESRQLLLPFLYAPAYDERDFLPAASNNDAQRWLAAAWPDDRLALWGPAGCGKSHMLHMWAERTGAALIDGRTLHDLDPVPHSGALALDDADSVPGETLLLHLLNTVRDRGLTILLASRTPPSRWPARLPDLSSRLRSLTAVEIRPPDDDLLAALLVRLLSDRQLSAPLPVQKHLLARLPRSPEALREAVARLDRASLAFGKAITKRLADQVLLDGGWAVSPADEVSMSGVDPSCQPPGLL